MLQQVVVVIQVELQVHVHVRLQPETRQYDVAVQSIAAVMYMYMHFNTDHPATCAQASAPGFVARTCEALADAAHRASRSDASTRRSLPADDPGWGSARAAPGACRDTLCNTHTRV